MTSATIEKTEVKLNNQDKWVTEWSCYVGEESLGKVRFAKTQFGMHKSYNENGQELILALELDHCVSATYWHLKWKRDGYDGNTDIKYDSVVGGKL